MKKLNQLVVLSFTVFLFTNCNNDKDDATSDESTLPLFATELNFTKLVDLGDNYFEDQMPGFLANPSNSSLYISCRDKFNNTEKTYKLNLNTLTLTSKNVILSDFVTKRNHIYNNRLYVFGASGYTNYNLDLNDNQPLAIYGNANNVFSRFGSALLNDNVYLVGGFLGGNTDDLNYDKKIWKYNLTTNLFTTEATMLKNRNGGSSEVLNNKLYTFFGYENIDDQTTTNPVIELLNDVQIYDINSNSFQTIGLQNQVKNSFTARYGNYIFVAGNKTAGSFSSPVNGSFFGYFDTTTNSMTEIPITVSDNSYTFPYICEIEVMNNKVYALVKNSDNTFSIQVANIN